MDEEDDPLMRWFDCVITAGVIVLGVGLLAALIISLFTQ